MAQRQKKAESQPATNQISRQRLFDRLPAFIKTGDPDASIDIDDQKQAEAPRFSVHADQ
jgi:hypothetical protein